MRLPGSAGRPAPARVAAGPRARDCGPWELQAVNWPRSPEVLSAAAGRHLFGLGEKVRECDGGLRTPNVDYLVRVSRAQKTHDLVSIRGLMHSTERPGRLPAVKSDVCHRPGEVF